MSIKSKTCNKCNKEKEISFFPKNKNQCKTCISIYQKQWRIDNKNHLKKEKAKWFQENKENNKEHRREYDKQYRKNNKGTINAKTAKRRAAKLQRTPSWINSKEVLYFYKCAAWLQKLTGIEFNVDHIFPLQGDWISGLHSANNLQIISARLNESKGIKKKHIPKKLNHMMW